MLSRGSNLLTKGLKIYSRLVNLPRWTLPKHFRFLSSVQFFLHFSRHNLGYSSFWSVFDVMLVNQLINSGSLPVGRGSTVVVAAVGTVVTVDSTDDSVVSGAKKT